MHINECWCLVLISTEKGLCAGNPNVSLKTVCTEANGLLFALKCNILLNPDNYFIVQVDSMFTRLVRFICLLIMLQYWNSLHIWWVDMILSTTITHHQMDIDIHIS